MSFTNHLVSSALLVGAVFSLTTFPLAAFSSKPVTVELERDTVFAGSLRDIAVPYLLTTAAISIGAGVANLAVVNWRQSSQKVVSLEGQMSRLTNQLTEKESQLEHLKFSQLKLESFGLTGFLEGDESSTPMSLAAHSTQLLPDASMIRAIEIPAIAQPLAISQPVSVPAAEQAASSDIANMRVVASFPAAQAFMGFVRPKPLEPETALPLDTLPVDDTLSVDNGSAANDLNLNNPDQVSELLSNLKQVMAQLEKLHPVKSEQAQTVRSYPHFAS